MKETIIKEKNVKIPLYVTVYETIRQWLADGKYQPGDRLPGENILAAQLDVSRGTLRQAMLLLQEDGLIINHQGKGNIVLSNQDITKNGLEKIGNPLVDFNSHPIERVETTVGFQPATKKHQEVLGLRASNIVAVIDITYYTKEGPAGFAMIYMPHEILDQNNVDLESTEAVYQFYTEFLQTSGLYSDSRLRLGLARERLAGILELEIESSIMILEEVLYSEFDTPVLSQKIFFSPNQYELPIRRKNDRNLGTQ